MEQTKQEIDAIDAAMGEIRDGFDGHPSELIPILQKVQRRIGYLPQEALMEIARFTGVVPARVFGVATFYEQFRFRPIGKHTLRICRGTACHVRGSDKIVNDIQTRLQVSPGETTRDGLFTLETVACFGSCALAPVVLIDDSVKGRMTASQTRKMITDIADQEQDTS